MNRISSSYFSAISKVGIALSLLTASISALAVEVRSHSFSVNSHRILASDVKSLKITLETNAITDGCNSYSISGSFRAAPLALGESELYNLHLGEFYVASTELPCPPELFGAEQTLKVDVEFPADSAGQVGLNLWLPADFYIAKIEEVAL